MPDNALMYIMVITKYTLKRIFRKAVKYLTRTAEVFVGLFVLFYLINNIIYGKVIWDNACKFQNAGDFRAAIELYNNAVGYFSFTDFMKINREKYIAVQYKKALCYLGLGKKDKADESINKGMYLITDSYGVNSIEYAQYVRKYVVPYYIDKKDFTSAKNYLRLAEYLYGKLKTGNLGELAEINYLYGDYYTALGQKEAAFRYYKNAYRLATAFDYTDFDVLIAATKYMAEFYQSNKHTKSAVSIYSKLLDTLMTRRCSDKAQFAYVKWLLASAYAKDGRDETAISYYDEAYSIIKKLPDNPEFYEIKSQLNDLRGEMARCYNSLGKYGSATKMQNEIKG